MAVVVSPLLSEKMSLEEVAKVVRLANSYKFVMNVYFEGYLYEATAHCVAG